MKNYHSIVMSFVVIAMTLALPVDAAVIDQVKNKVDAIKNETSTIKNKVNGVVDKLDPLTKLQNKFAEFGFDPSEFLDMIPAEDVQKLMEDLREGQAEAQAMINDPNIETFRYELLETLAGIRNILTVDEFDNMPLPLEAIVQNAPPPALGIIKAATEGVFEGLQTNITEASKMLNEFRAAGLFDLMNVSVYPRLRSNLPTNMLTPVVSLDTEEQNERLCKVASNLMPLKLSLWAYKQRLKDTSHQLEQIVHKMETKIKGKEIKVGIHGYFGFNYKPGEKSKRRLGIMKLQMDQKVTFIEGVGELIDQVQSFEACSLLVDSLDNPGQA